MTNPVSTLNSFIPSNYQQLGMQWGLNPSYAGLVAFAASILLIWGIVYLGMWLSFGKIIEDSSRGSEYKRIFIVISAAIAIFATLGAADLIVLILSNIIYIVGVGAAIIVVASVFRALTSGWYGAGATVASAKAKELGELTKLEKKKKDYLEARQKAIGRVVTTTKEAAREITNIFNTEVARELNDLITIFKSDPNTADIASRLQLVKNRLANYINAINANVNNPLVATAYMRKFIESLKELEALAGEYKLKDLGKKIKIIESRINEILKQIDSLLLSQGAENIKK